MNPNIAKETWTSASNTIGGATSKDDHKGLGQPVSGQSSNELHGTRKKERVGLRASVLEDGIRLERGGRISISRLVRRRRVVWIERIFGCRGEGFVGAEQVASERK